MKALLETMLRRGAGGACSDIRYERREIAELTLDESGLRVAAHQKSGGCFRAWGPHGTTRRVFTELPPSIAQIHAGAELASLEETAGQLRQIFESMRRLPAVRAAQILYREERAHKWLESSLGRTTEQRQHPVFVLLTMVLHNGQLATEVLSGVRPGFALENELARLEDSLRFAEAIAAGTAVTAGEHDVVLDPQLAGSIIHETVGHICEADNEDRSRSIRSD